VKYSIPRLVNLANVADAEGVCMDGSGADYSAVCSVGPDVGGGPNEYCHAGGAADMFCNQGVADIGILDCTMGGSNVGGCSVGTGATG